MRLLWKEWQLQKWIIFWGFLAGLSFPVFECLFTWNRSGNFRTDSGSGVLLAGGAVFAIILAIGTTHHDMRRGVDNFWQSKPVKLWKFITVKFLLVSFLLFIIFIVVISLDLITHFGRDGNFMFAWMAFCYTYPIALLLFALSMFLMVITRDAAKAAFLAIWAGLLIYFLPLMFRGLEWMNIFERLNNSFNDQPSVVQYLIWLCSVPEKINSGVGIYRPAGIPVTVYKQTVFQHLLEIVHSPAYLQYLLFVAVFLVVAFVCVVLSVKALRNNWRWRPGQKSIVWTMGVSAAAIFGVAMFQVGHNLEPVKEFKGQELINPVRYDWNYMPTLLHEGLPEGYWIGSDHRYSRDSDALCLKDDLMFRFTVGYQSDKGVDQWNTELIRHFVLQVYEFPYSERNYVDSDKAPAFVVGATRFFETKPVKGNWVQAILGCFVRRDRLYAAYRPLHNPSDNGDQQFPDAPMNPMYFITFDISNPSVPKVISNIEISRANNLGRGMSDIGDYCYINDGTQLMILSVENKDNPEIVHKITFDDDFMNRPTELGPALKKMVWFPSQHMLIAENKLICWDHYRVSIFDISDKLNPQVIYDERFNDKYSVHRNGIQELAFRDDTLYIGTEDGISVYSLKLMDDGLYASRLIGQRKATPLEKLAGRNPKKLLLSGDYLIEQAGGFGAIVYDISSPAKPRRIYHAQVDNFASNIGFWNGLLFLEEFGPKTTFYKLPENQVADKE